ncbi:hypothetical protein [Domibacillus indicus]|uniref:hypothetical protein n=1 Tax=Domibacillus indicus TaxID=1437523 RepID=UPI00061833C2|nr:hypothetical protein [Domibacillus indicus]
MLRDHVKALSIVSVLSIIAGLVFMFSSLSLGTALGDSWLDGQISQSAEADTSQYDTRIKMYTNNFVILGTVLLCAGILTVLLTYFASVRFGVIENSGTKNEDNFIEKG